MWQQECWTLILLMSDLSPIPILTHQLWQCSGQYRKKLALNYKENNDFWAAIDKQSICRKKPHGGFTSYQSSRGNARIICFHAGKHEIGWGGGGGGEQPLTSSGLLSGNCTLIVLFLCLAHHTSPFFLLLWDTPHAYTEWVYFLGYCLPNTLFPVICHGCGELAPNDVHSFFRCFENNWPLCSSESWFSVLLGCRLFSAILKQYANTGIRWLVASLLVLFFMRSDWLLLTRNRERCATKRNTKAEKLWTWSFTTK